MLCLRVLFIFNLLYVGRSVRIEFLNTLGGPIWLGGQAKSGYPLPHGGGWALDKDERIAVELPSEWAGRFWARTWCLEDNNSCETGDCGNKFECRGSKGQSPATLADFVFRGRNFVDYYSISLVDGFNTKITITPLNQHGSKSRCKEIACTANINDDCPEEQAVTNEAGTIGCRSACEIFDSDQHCCKGAFNTSDTCKPTQYSRMFKQKCPQAQSYRFDSANNVYSCQANSYLVTFSQ